MMEQKTAEVAEACPPDMWEEAQRAIISDGPWAAAFLIVFLALLFFTTMVFKFAVKEIREAHKGERNANERNEQAAKESVKTMTQLVGRLDRVVEMDNDIIGSLRGLRDAITQLLARPAPGGGGGDVPTDS